MATITKTYPTDQMNYWSTGISIPSGQYISSISIHCDYGYNQASSAVALYIDGKQLATIAGNLVGAVNGSASGTITGTTISASQNTFSFRAQVTITYTLASYATPRTISKVINAAGSGELSTKVNGTEVTSAAKGATVNVSANAYTGYSFWSWTTSPANLISGSSANTSFTMPDQNVTIQANFWKHSTGRLSKTSMNGGETITLTISMTSQNLSHKYNLSFNSPYMNTGDVSVAAGVSSVDITVPMEWCAQIPNTTSRTNGTLTLKTYYGSTYIGETTITGLTFNVPASVKPTMGTITASIARTIDNVTYANIGDIYAQNHSGVRVQASASAPTSGGVALCSITSISVKVGNYAGNKYNHTTLNDSIDFTSGLLGTAGTNTITVTATDSRGRTNSASVDITVSAYTKPSGSLEVWRVNSGGTTDDQGVYGKYQLSKTYSAIGNNSLTWTLAVSGYSASSPGDTDDLLPNNRVEFSETQEYTVTLTLTDGLETTVITAKLPSARFVMAFDSTGNKIGIMKFPNKAIPTGKNRTFEISDDTQVYMGDITLEDMLRAYSHQNGVTWSNSVSVSTRNRLVLILLNAWTRVICWLGGNYSLQAWVSTINSDNSISNFRKEGEGSITFGLASASGSDVTITRDGEDITITTLTNTTIMVFG